MTTMKMMINFGPCHEKYDMSTSNGYKQINPMMMTTDDCSPMMTTTMMMVMRMTMMTMMTMMTTDDQSPMCNSAPPNPRQWRLWGLVCNAARLIVFPPLCLNLDSCHFFHLIFRIFLRHSAVQRIKEGSSRATINYLNFQKIFPCRIPASKLEELCGIHILDFRLNILNNEWLGYIFESCKLAH